jgi:hypothetical protein
MRLISTKHSWSNREWLHIHCQHGQLEEIFYPRRAIKSRYGTKEFGKTAKTTPNPWWEEKSSSSQLDRVFQWTFTNTYEAIIVTISERTHEGQRRYSYSPKSCHKNDKNSQIKRLFEYRYDPSTLSPPKVVWRTVENDSSWNTSRRPEELSWTRSKREFFVHWSGWWTN